MAGTTHYLAKREINMSNALIIKANEAITPNSIQREALTDRQVYVFDVRSLASQYSVDTRVPSFKPNVISAGSASLLKTAGVWTSEIAKAPFLRYSSTDGYYLDFSRSNGDAYAALRTDTITDASANDAKGIFVIMKFKIVEWNSSFLPDYTTGVFLGSYRLLTTATGAGGSHAIRLVLFKNKLVMSGVAQTQFAVIDATTEWVTVAVYVAPSSNAAKAITSIDNTLISKTTDLTPAGNFDTLAINDNARTSATADYTPKMHLKYLGLYRGTFIDSEIMSIFNYVKSL